jgi:hypothetical protein
MLRFKRRLGISAETIFCVKVARIAKKMRCMPSQILDEKADEIEAFMMIDEIERENAEKENNQQ